MNIFRAREIFKICIIAILVFTLLSIPSFGDVQNVTVSVIPNPKIDVVLSQTNSNVDMTNFEKDLRTKFESNGFNTNNVNVQTVDTNIVDTSNQDASAIFNKWDKFPYNRASNWYYNSSEGYISSDVNEAYETGFIDKSNGKVRDITLDSKILSTQYTQPLGYLLRMSPQSGNPNRWNMYILWVSGWDGYNYTVPNLNGYNASGGVYVKPPQRSIILFKVEGLYLDYNYWSSVSTSGTYAATPLAQTMYNGRMVLGWPYHLPRAYGGYPDNTPLVNGTTVTNSGDKSLKTTTLGWSNNTVTGSADTFNLKVQTKGQNFKVYYNDVLQFEVNDSSYYDGYYGIFEFSHVSPRFYGIKAELTKYKSFNEILHAPTWRENAYHILVNVNDEEDKTMTGADVAGENSMRLLNDKIHLLQWGRDANKDSTINFIKQMNDGNGMYTDNSNYQQAVTDTANYIENLVKQGTSSQYVIVRRRY